MNFQLLGLIFLTSSAEARLLRIKRHTGSAYEKINIARKGKNLEEFRLRVMPPRKNIIANAGGQTASWVASWVGKLAPVAKPVGKGAFGKVYIASVSCDGSKVAVKQMNVKGADVQAEANLLKAFSGFPEFISYFDHGRGSGASYYIMMEAALGDTLSKIIDGRNPSSQQDKMQLFLDMLLGIGKMHEQNLVHRDLKPANVFISRVCGHASAPCHAKVGDLGLACVMRGGSMVGMPTCGGIGGTPLYIAPETYKSATVHPKNDVWAMGLMLYELTFGHLPRALAKSRSLRELEKNVKSFVIMSDIDYKTAPTGTTVQKLLYGMLANNYKNRMSTWDAIKLASELVHKPHVDAVGKLPDCFFMKESSKPPVIVDPLDMKPTPTYEEECEESHESLDEVDFFTIHQAMTNIATNFMFNAEIVDPKTGIVVAENSKLKDLKRYGFMVPLQKGFKILEVNDKAFTSLSNDDVFMLKNGMLGSSLTFKFAK